MSSYSPLPNKFFKDFCQPDLKKNPTYGLITKVIGEDVCKDFLEEIKEKKIKVDAKTKSGKKGIRQVDAWRIPLKSNIGDRFNHITLDLNYTFNYRLSCIQDIQYLEYKVGDYYDWHSDVSEGISSLRKISMSYVLNDDFEGGELEIFHGGENYVLDAKIEQLVAFTSFMNHRVRKVTKGVRKALVVWINGEAWR